ncbi:MAG: aspartate kinase [Tenericutes bacterium]|nr:aspartate kinase [Mycoplasmatota bacterium]
MQKVAKFGGSSVANASQIRKIKSILEADTSREILVTSAIGKDKAHESKLTDLLYLLYAHIEYGIDYNHILKTITDRFLDIKNDLSLSYDIEKEIENLKKELTKDISKDYLVSRGEYFTAKLLEEYLGYQFVDAKDIIMLHYDGTVDYETTETQLKNVLKKHKKIIVPGFYAKTPNDKIRLFSRGGSDITGSILAKVSKADLYENWTDVDGIYAADPKLVDNPKLIHSITYSELRELSYRGANVLNQETILPLANMGIPLKIKNTFNPESSGTLISDKFAEANELLTGISGLKNFTSFNITKDSSKQLILVLKNVLNLFIRYKINIEHIPTGIDTFSMIVKTEDIKDYYFDLINEVREIEGVIDLSLEDDIALVAIVSRNMTHIPGVAGRIFTTLGNHNINIKIIAQASTEISIIIGVSNVDYEKAIKVVYKEFYKD